jgi:hypothetical protein
VRVPAQGVRPPALAKAPAEILPRLRHLWVDVPRAVLELDVDVAGRLDEDVA